jgi:hypothetical protein
MNSTKLVCSTLFSNIPCGNFKLWQHSNTFTAKPSKHAVHKALEAHRPHRLLVPQGSGIPKAALLFRPSAEHASKLWEIFIQIKNSIIHYPDWKVMDIVQEWLFKRHWVR